MSRVKNRSRSLLLKRDNSENYTWSVWRGIDPNTATQMLNIDGSEPRLLQTSVTNEMLAYDSNLTINTEIFKFSWVHDDEPDANSSYWISDDGGVTKTKVNFSYKKSRNQKAFWKIYFKKN